jgi:hypothetical protein
MHHGGIDAPVGADVLCRDGCLVFIATMQRGVRGIKGEVEEEGFFVLGSWFLALRMNALDEVAGLGAEKVGQIVRRIEAFVFSILEAGETGAFSKRVHAAGDADELIKAAFVRRFEFKAGEVGITLACPGAVAAEMPFSDVRGAVSVLLEHIG